MKHTVIRGVNTFSCAASPRVTDIVRLYNPTVTVFLLIFSRALSRLIIITIVYYNSLLNAISFIVNNCRRSGRRRRISVFGALLAVVVVPVFSFKRNRFVLARARD